MGFDLNIALGLDDSNDSDPVDNTSEEANSNENDETSKKCEEVPGQRDCTKETLKQMDIGGNVLDLNVALGLDNQLDESDENYSKSSEDADSSGDEETSKNSTQSIEKTNFNEDDEFSTKSDESIRISNGNDGANIGFLANEIEKKLEVGCCLADLEQCYLLYCEYARLTGFSVRKGDQRYIERKSDVIIWKEFTCSCKGFSDPKRSKDRVANYRKLVLRTNCMAKIRVDRIDETWKITKFKKIHNHTLVDIDQSYLLRSSRKLSFAKSGLLQAMHSSGIPIYKACGFMEKISGGVQNTGFLRKDAYNYFDKTKQATRVEDGDAMALIEYCNEKSNSDPFFFWKVEKDEDGRLMNLFFRDSRCASDFKTFGDVLLLDTTGGTNRYKFACAPFVGVNHHMTNVMFGIGFLSNERESSFNWLLEAFLESMNGIAPKVVFTDQCKALMNAVDSKFPNTTHRLCQWHINRNAKSHFPKPPRYGDFKDDWHRCMKKVETEDEFENLWRAMMNSYEISDREWFDSMYGLRRRWACVFSKNVFTAGIRATSRSECTNKVLKECAKSTGSLYEFICEFENIQTRWRTLEREEDTHCLWLPGQVVNGNNFLIHAATIYTRKVYKVFERELTQTFNVQIDFEKAVSLGEGNIQFKAMRKGKGSTARERTVVFNHSSNSATCSCGKWEREGLLCRHILKVYSTKNIEAIPEPYILKRWTKKAKNVVSPSDSPRTTSGLLSSMQFVHDITRTVFDLACIESSEARKDIAETIFALRERVLISSGVASVSSLSKKKRKANSGNHFHDPKMPKERANATVQKKSKELSKRQKKSKKVS